MLLLRYDPVSFTNSFTANVRKTCSFVQIRLKTEAPKPTETFPRSESPGTPPRTKITFPLTFVHDLTDTHEVLARSAPPVSSGVEFAAREPIFTVRFGAGFYTWLGDTHPTHPCYGVPLSRDIYLVHVNTPRIVIFAPLLYLKVKKRQL